jgi:hypothetical protein
VDSGEGIKLLLEMGFALVLFPLHWLGLDW